MKNRTEGIERYLVCLKSDVFGKKVSLELIRHLSPITIERLYRNIPLSGMVVRDRDVIYISIPIEARVEKPRNKLRRGQVGYSPAKKMLVIALSDVRLDEKINSLGRITEGLEELENLRTGSIVRLERP